MKKEANVIVLHCDRHGGKIYGVRVEKQHGDWVRTWAFPMSEAAAKREGYDKLRLKGSFAPTEEYPGCPYCGGKRFWLCSCGAMHCWDGETMNVTCSVCGQSASLEFANSLDIRGGGY